MKDLSKEIFYYSRKFQIASKCPLFKADQECTREGGCVCAKYGEIKALIHSLIDPAYRNATISTFTGVLPDGRVAVETSKVNDVRKKIWTYLYGEKRVNSGYDRNQLNQISVMDKRFTDGDNLVIYGESFVNEKDGGFILKKHVPMGKTLLASIVLIDAIYRRAFNTNKAMTYDRVSFLSLKNLLKQKDKEALYEIQDVDWLVIDDMNIIDNRNVGDRINSWTKETLDAFLIDRFNNRKPTILVCNFDISKISLQDRMGEAFEKIVTASNTHLVKV